MEEDEAVDSFFPTDTSPLPESALSEGSVEDAECAVIVRWIVVFTCVFQTLHSISLRAMQWLLAFLSTLLCLKSIFRQSF